MFTAIFLKIVVQIGEYKGEEGGGLLSEVWLRLPAARRKKSEGERER